MIESHHFTQHAVKRFKERFADCVIDKDVFKSLAKIFYASKETKAFVNNTAFMVYMMEEHDCYEGMQMFENTENNIIFICSQNRLITLYPKNSSRFREESKRYKK